MLGKIYRGGVHRTTPETYEVNYTGDATELLPGTVVALDETDGLTTVVGAGTFFYILGESLHGGVDDNLLADESSLRCYTPRSGDLYCGRAAAGVTLVNDMPLTVNASGYFAEASAGDPGAEPPVPADPIHAYVEMPSNSNLQIAGPTVAGQRIPIKIK